MSSNQKNNYPLEFKISSAQLAVESKQSVAKTARDLGVNHNTLHGWIEKYSDSNQVSQKNMNSDKATKGNLMLCSLINIGLATLLTFQPKKAGFI
jgi:transposase